MLRVNSRFQWRDVNFDSRHIFPVRLVLTIFVSVTAGIGIVWLVNTLPVDLSTLVVCLGGLVVWILVVFRRSAFSRDLPFFHYIGACSIVVGTAMISFNGLRAGSDMMVADIFLLVGAILLIPVLFSTPLLLQSLPMWLILSASLLLISGFLSAINSSNTEEDVTRVFRFTIALLGVPFVLSITANSNTRLMFIVDIWSSFVAISAIIGFLDFLGVTSIGLMVSGNLFGTRFSGLSAHPNHLALACTMSLPVTLSRLAIARKPFVKISYLVSVISLILGVFVSGSRAGFLAGIFGISFMIFYLRNTGKYLLFIILIFTLSILFTVTYIEIYSKDIFMSVQRLTGSVSTEDSDVNRLERYSEALSDFTDNPIVGQGFSNIRIAHNIYLQLLQSGGLVGFLAFTIFSFCVLRLGWKLMHRSNIPVDMKNLAGALTASMLVWLLVGLVHNQMYDRFLYVPAGLMLGLEFISAGQYKG